MSSDGKKEFEALFYPGTKTLINHFNERDPATLEKLERSMTSIADYALRQSPVPGKFDLEHMREIHRQLMGGVYPWAGQVRDFPLFKKRVDGFITEFARPEEIAGLDKRLQEIMERTQSFRGVPAGKFVEEIAKVYQTANEMHPFREGNGRTHRLYLRYLADQAGFKLNFATVSPDAWNHAASMSARINLGDGQRVAGRTTELEKVFAHISAPLKANAYQQGREGMATKGRIMTLADLNPSLTPTPPYTPRLRVR